MPVTIRRAFTLTEVLTVIALACTMGAVAVASAGGGQPLDPLTKSRQSARQLKDATQQRSILQGIVIWSQQNKDFYPLPSMIDKADATVALKGRAKDTTANILSLLIWNGSITPEFLTSPLENNSKIKDCKDYQTSNPKAAVKPASALWDPAFNCDFTGERPGNNSYAYLQPSGVPSTDPKVPSTGRIKEWSSTFNSSQPAMCTRGPQIASVAYGQDDVATPKFANDKSNTFAFFKPEGSWSGNVAFNDCHVEFFAGYFAPGQKVNTGAMFTNAEGKKRPDLAFFDEPDDPKAANNFLGIFTTAGEKPADFKAIWD